MRCIRRAGDLRFISCSFHLSLFLFLFFCRQTPVEAGPIDSTYSLLFHETQQVIYPHKVILDLPDPFILEHSETLFTPSGPLERGLHYHIDYVKGQIVLIKVFADTTRVTVAYRRLPVAIRTSYTHRNMVIEYALSDTLPRAQLRRLSNRRTSVTAASFRDESTLRAGGSKTFSVTTGSNRDATITQSLRIQITGKATKDVEVIAVLSDKTNPIQPEGTTRQLTELDQVFIQIKTPSTMSTMGDHTIQLDETTFARYQRKIKGVHGVVQLPNGTFQMAAAVSEGEYKSNVIQGIEGVQGPYQLSGSQETLDLFVIAGTEKVWVDGIRMTRGRDNDYTIEYTSGQVTFTRNRLITGESRIVVDFEASEQPFQRQVYVGRGTFSVGRNTTLGTTFIREGDDRNSPQPQSLFINDLQSLQKPAIPSDQNRVSGVQFVGIGKGTYAKRRDLTYDMDYYEFVGDNQGAYQVSFTHVNQGEGTYLFRENRLYQFVGPLQGDYVPEIDLYLPTSHSLVGFDLKSEPVNGMQVFSEFAVSTVNSNTFSQGANRQIQRGHAFNLSTNYESAPMTYHNRSIGQFTFQSNIRQVDKHFIPSGRINEIEYHRRYGQGTEAAWQGQLIELNGSHTLNELLTINGGMGRLTRDQSFSSNRQEFGFSLTPRPSANLSYRYEHIQINELRLPPDSPIGTPLASAELNRQWIRQYIHGRIKLGSFTPYIGFEQEKRHQRLESALDNGRNYSEIKSGFEYSPSPRFTSSTHFTYRLADIVGKGNTSEQTWLTESVAHTIQQKLAMKGWKSFSAFIQMTHRSRIFKEAPGENNQDQMVDSRILFSPLNKAVSIESRYEISNERTSQRARRYVLAGRGRGDYRLDPFSGEYIQDTDGEYIERFDRIGGFTPITSVKSSFRFQTQPYRLISGTDRDVFSILKHISTDTYFAVEEQSKSGNKADLYLLRLSQFQQDNTTVFGNLIFRQDIFLFPQKRGFSLRLRYRKNSLLNNQLISGSERRYRSEYSIRLRTSVASRTTAEFQYAREIKTRRDFGVDRFHLISHNSSLIVAKRPRPPLELRIQFQGNHDTDRQNGITAILIGIVPRLTYSFRGKGRARFEIDWSQVSSSSTNFYLPFEMVNGKPAGHSARWTGAMDYRLGQNFSLLMQYDGRKDPVRPMIHTARAEVRAVF